MSEAVAISRAVSATAGGGRRLAADPDGGRHQDLRRGRARGAGAARRRPRDRGRPDGRDHRPLGLGQVDADAHPGLPRRAERGALPARGPRRLVALGVPARRDPQPEDRLRVPDLQPAREGVAAAQRRAAAALRRAVGLGAQGARARSARARGPARAREAPAGGALGRPAPARGDRARDRQPALADPRRRADRQPRHEDRPRDPRDLRRDARQGRDDRDRHPRPAHRGALRARRLDRRRPHRRRPPD